MLIVYNLIVVLHLLCMAAILSGLVVQLAAPGRRALAIVSHSAGLQVLLGLALTGIASAGLIDKEVDNAKIGTKLVIALIVFALAFYLWRKGEASRTRLAVIGALVLANVAIAVYW